MERAFPRIDGADEEFGQRRVIIRFADEFVHPDPVMASKAADHPADKKAGTPESHDPPPQTAPQGERDETKKKSLERKSGFFHFDQFYLQL